MQIAYDPHNQKVLTRASSEPFSSPRWFALKRAAEELSLSDGFERLIGLGRTPLTLFPHQERAVKRVLSEMRGRAILADEVGLGKTIEAGVILKEYLVRRLVERALILVPATLVEQWRAELYERLALAFSVGRRPDDFASKPLLIASIDTAKREANRAVIQARPWEMVIVDEAHRLKSRTTINWRFVNGIQKRYLLLLTATPIQNDLREIYNLVTLVKPGQLKTFAHFKRYYMLDRHQPKNAANLREALREVMVRTSRRETTIPFARRHVRSVALTPTGPEEEFYREMLRALRAAFAQTPKERRNLLPLILVLREATSHPTAALASLRVMRERKSIAIARETVQHLQRLAGRFTPAKLRFLCASLTPGAERAIVFTEFRATQTALYRALRSTGLHALPFHGGLKEAEKERVIDDFRQQGGILLSTQAGGEGRNLQFCRRVINYDLPWNPMRVEQRIGRVHRIGQREDVEVVNMVTAGTIEEYVLDLLEKKIDMFERVIGEIDAILTGMDGTLDERVARVALESPDDEAMKQGFLALGEELTSARAAYERSRGESAKWLDGKPE